MGLFEKKNCVRCGKELGLIFGKIKIKDGMICKDCNALLSPLLTNKSSLSLAEIEEHIRYRNQNQVFVNAFKATKTIGNNERLYVDEANKKFLVSSTSSYASKNIDVFNLSEVTRAELVISIEDVEKFKEDAEGNEVSYDPPQYDKYYGYKVEVNLNHKWIKELTIDVTNENINGEDGQANLDAKNIGNEMVAVLLQKSFVAETTIATSTTTTSDGWICAKCGATNSLESKFCTNCGEAKAAAAKFCGNCGSKLPEGTKFCPECGKAVN